MNSALSTRIGFRCVGVTILVAVVVRNVGGFTIIDNRHLAPLYRSSDLSVGLEVGPTIDNQPAKAIIKQQIEKQGTDSVLPTMDEIHDSLGTDYLKATRESSSPCTTFRKRRDTRPFPLSMVIGQQEIKHALLLSAVNPHSIGVVISGGRGTGKSVIARSIKNIVPSHIPRIRNSEYNIDPDGTGGIDSFLLQQLQDGEKSIESIETELIPTPFVQIVSFVLLHVSCAQFPASCSIILMPF